MTQNFKQLDQLKNMILKNVLHLKPHDYQITYVNLI